MPPSFRRLRVSPRRLAAPAALAWLAVMGVGTQASALGTPQSGAVRGDPAVRCEFRVFAGAEEVTGEVRIRVSPTDASAQGIQIEPGIPVALTPGLYDVQAVRMQQERVVAIRRAERIAIVRYPDEGDLHLEVLNFDPRFGALQIRPAVAGRPPAFSAFAYDPPGREQPVGASLQGDAYALLVLPGGIYDIRIQAGGAAASPGRTDLWLLGVEVRADHSRVRLLPPDWGRTAGSRRH